MIQNPEYVLKYINAKPRLIPIGQANANLNNDIITNDFGAFVLTEFRKNKDPQAVLEACFAKYADNDDDKAVIRKSFDSYTDSLCTRGILSREDEIGSPVKTITFYNAYDCHNDITYIKIADLYIKLVCPNFYVPADFKEFITEAPLKVDPNKVQTVNVWDLSDNSLKTTEVVCRTVLETDEVHTYELDNEFFLTFPMQYSIKEMCLEKNGSTTDIFSTDLSKPSTSDELFQTMRMAFLPFAERHGLFALHSASIVYRDHVWAFSGISGTGKTTHTNLWKQALGVPVFNGDVNLIGISNDGTPMVYGLPWCGTSGISVQGEYPLGGIVLLNQAQTDHMGKLATDVKIAAVLHRLISPVWTELMLDMCLEFVKELAEKSHIELLYCTPNFSAYEVSKNTIDSLLNA